MRTHLLTQITLSLLVAQMVSPLTTPYASEVLTKKRAFAIMKENGFKWKETSLIVDDAHAKSKLADAQFYPYVNLISREFVAHLNPIQYGGSELDSISWVTGGQTALQVYYDIFAATSKSRLRAAEFNEKMSAATRDKYQNELTFVMLATYLSSQRYQKKLTIVDAAIQRSTHILKIAKERVASGAGVRLDLLRAQTLLEFDKLKKLDVEASYDKAVSNLALTLGKESIEETIPPIKHKNFSLHSTQGDTVVNRPDVQSARYMSSASQELVAAVENERIPKFSFFGDMGILGTHNAFGVGNDLNGTVGVQLSMPIFSLSLNGRTDLERVQARKTELEADQVALEAKSDLEQAIKQLRQSQKVFEVSNHQIEVVDEELKVAETRFAAGSFSGLEYGTTRTNYASAQDSNIEATFLFELAKINYFKATGNFAKYFELEGEQ